MTSSTFVIAGLLAFALAIFLLAKWQERRQDRQADAERLAAQFWPNGSMVTLAEPLTDKELMLATLDHGAESFATQLGLFREDDDDVKAREWRAAFDAALHDLDARFAAIAVDLGDPLPPYWPSAAQFDDLVRSVAPVTGAPVPTYLTTDEIAAVVGPEAVLEVIRREGEAPTVFSWTTSEYAAVPASAAVAPHRGRWPLPAAETWDMPHARGRHVRPR